MIRSTQIARLDGLMLYASVDDENPDVAVEEVKSQVRQVLRKLNRNSEPQVTIECGQFHLQYIPFPHPPPTMEQSDG
jgi:vesicle transport protein SEC22